MKKVLLLFGGNSSEHHVSCLSAKGIIEQIDNKKFQITTVGIGLDNKWYKFQDKTSYLENGTWIKAPNTIEIENIIPFIKEFDIIFPIIHGKNGEDGKLQGFLDLFQLKYVGCKTLSSTIGMDKHFSKIFFDHIGIPQLPYRIIYCHKENLKKQTAKIKFPVIVKPCNSGSSIGISKANNKKELMQAIKSASQYDEKLIIEPFIHMRELECAVLEEKKELIISAVGEIISANEFYDYNAKYENKDSKTLIPNDLPKHIIDKIQNYCIRIFEALELNGLSRMDFFYDVEENRIYLNEINTLPGFTPISMYPKLLEENDISYRELITILLENA